MYIRKQVYCSFPGFGHITFLQMVSIYQFILFRRYICGRVLRLMFVAWHISVQRGSSDRCLTDFNFDSRVMHWSQRVFYHSLLFVTYCNLDDFYCTRHSQNCVLIHMSASHVGKCHEYESRPIIILCKHSLNYIYARRGCHIGTKCGIDFLSNSRVASNFVIQLF